MTTTRSASSAIDAEVVGDQDDRRVRLAPAPPCSTSRICAWIVTSSAVVGSSAMSSSGRWRSPSRSSRAGACRPRTRAGTARRGARRTGRRRSRAARSRAPRAASSFMSGWCVASASAIWSPTVSTGFSDVIGSWKIIAMSPPRIVAQLLLRHLQQVLALVDRLARRDPARGLGSARGPRASRRSCPSRTRRRCRAPRPAAGRS